MPNWRIYPLDVGEMEYDKSEETIRRGMGTKVREKFTAWYLTDGARKILVDTGPPDEERARRWHPYTNPTIYEHQRIDNALRARGAEPEEIKLVILTHLHWDHSGNMPLFTNAEFIVAAEELRYAVDPVPINYTAYESPQLGIGTPFLTVMPRVRTVAMVEQEVAPGVTIFPTPGHTPGSMSVQVETARGPYIIAGDAVACYENLEGDPGRKLKYIPTGIYTDLVAMWNSMALIHARALFDKNRVLPGHELKVFQHACYPPEEG